MSINPSRPLAEPDPIQEADASHTEGDQLATRPAGAVMPGERGMATAEYAVGILAAVALALVLLKVITHESFFGTLLKIVVTVVGKIAGMLP